MTRGKCKWASTRVCVHRNMAIAADQGWMRMFGPYVCRDSSGQESRELAASLPRWDEEAVSWSFSVARLRFAADGKDKQRGDQKVTLSLDERRLARNPQNREIRARTPHLRNRLIGKKVTGFNTGASPNLFLRIPYPRNPTTIPTEPG